MRERFSEILRQGIRQGILLLALGVALGVVWHELVPSPLPWVGLWTPSAVADRHLQGLEEASLDDAWSLHKAGRALFLDARDERSFEMGHLPGALHIPPDQGDAHVPELQALSQAGMALIAYCDGMDCPLSSELARGLQGRGLPAVKVLVNGWSLWQRAGYPVEKGKAP